LSTGPFEHITSVTVEPGHGWMAREGQILRHGTSCRLHMWEDISRTTAGAPQGYDLKTTALSPARQQPTSVVAVKVVCVYIRWLQNNSLFSTDKGHLRAPSPVRLLCVCVCVCLRHWDQSQISWRGCNGDLSIPVHPRASSQEGA